MKANNVTIDNAAEKVYRQLMATLGLKGARKAQLQLGRLILQEKKRREKLDGGKPCRK